MATINAKQPVSERLGIDEERDVTVKFYLGEDGKDAEERIMLKVQKYGADVIDSRIDRALTQEVQNGARQKLGEKDKEGNLKWTPAQIIKYYEEDCGTGAPWKPGMVRSADPTKTIRDKVKKLTPEQREALIAELQGEGSDE